MSGNTRLPEQHFSLKQKKENGGRCRCETDPRIGAAHLKKTNGHGGDDIYFFVRSERIIA